MSAGRPDGPAGNMTDRLLKAMCVVLYRGVWIACDVCLAAFEIGFLPPFRSRLVRSKEEDLHTSRVHTSRWRLVFSGERLGRASGVRPRGRLLWIHAASIGEAEAGLALMQTLHENLPILHVLLTTNAPDAACAMHGRLPAYACHQFAPLDTMRVVRRFLAHWKPDAAIFVESELWPNLLCESAKRFPVALVNGKVSERTLRIWRWVRPFSRHVVGCFCMIVAQSEQHLERFRSLRSAPVCYAGNLKTMVRPLPANQRLLVDIESALQGRQCWLAASVRLGEEDFIAVAHKSIVARFPRAVLLVVPRHPHEGRKMLCRFRAVGLRAVLRSTSRQIEGSLQVYIADTIGELGLWYRVARIVLVGGTLIAHGGHNPLEAARLCCAIVVGPHTSNFQQIAEDMRAEKALVSLHSTRELGATIQRLLSDRSETDVFARRAMSFVRRENQRTVCRIRKILLESDVGKALC